VGFTSEFRHGSWRVIVEDDDQVGYAYLLDDDGVVADVWLYNHGPDPVTRPWTQGAEMPFRNPAEFTGGDKVQLPVSAEGFQVSWSRDGAKVEAEVRLAGRAIAWLVPGTRPGWSTRVVRDGPLARFASCAAKMSGDPRTSTFGQASSLGVSPRTEARRVRTAHACVRTRGGSAAPGGAEGEVGVGFVV
jgi:hypothetical protein